MDNDFELVDILRKLLDLADKDIGVDPDHILKRVQAYHKWKDQIAMYEQPIGGFAGMTFEEFIQAIGLSIDTDELKLIEEILNDRVEEELP